MSINKYTVVCSPASATTTNYIKVVNGYLWMGETPATMRRICQSTTIKNGVKHVAAAESLQTTSTLTFVGTGNDVKYSFVIRQYDASAQKFINTTFSYTTPQTGTVTATATGAAVAAMITANAQFMGTASNSSGTVTIAATAGYPLFFVDIVDIGGGLTYSAGTLGSVAYGKDPYTALRNAGITGDIPASTAGYTGFTFNFLVPLDGQNGTNQYALMDGAFFVNTDATDAAALITAADAILL